MPTRSWWRLSDGMEWVWLPCPLIRLDSTMTGQRYVNILSDHLHPFMSCAHSDGRGQIPTVVSDTECCAIGLNPGEGMDVCKRIMSLKHGDTLNSSRAASLLVRLMEEVGWEALDHRQDALPQNWGGTKPNHTVT
ncbi:hypothetical protein TNCV_2173801 [Trichonephila clavipes]|nr:hypothetical protein TNCV_2173801 [Trichonephila clavipes]